MPSFAGTGGYPGDISADFIPTVPFTPIFFSGWTMICESWMTNQTMLLIFWIFWQRRSRYIPERSSKNNENEKYIWGALKISHFPSMGSDDPPPLVVENVKIMNFPEFSTPGVGHQILYTRKLPKIFVRFARGKSAPNIFLNPLDAAPLHGPSSLVASRRVDELRARVLLP